MVDVDEMTERGRYLMRMFATSGYKTLYKPIFGTPQFPFWLIIQCLYSCYVVHRSFLRKPRTPPMIVKQIVVSFCMVFLPREIFAFMFSKLSPIIHNPLSIVCFVLVALAMNFFPFDVFYKATNSMYSLLGLLMGLNQTRFFTLILRSVKGMSSVKLVPIALLFTVMDQLIEISLRTLFKGNETKMSNLTTVFRTSVFSGVFWLATHDNLLSPYIGRYQIYVPALILGLVLGIANGTAILNNSEIDYELSNANKNASRTPSRNQSRAATPRRSDMRLSKM